MKSTLLKSTSKDFLEQTKDFQILITLQVFQCSIILLLPNCLKKAQWSHPLNFLVIFPNETFMTL